MVIASRFLPDRAKDRLMVLLYKTAGRMTTATATDTDHSSTGSAIVVGTPR